jgi:hypothetical protein
MIHLKLVAICPNLITGLAMSLRVKAGPVRRALVRDLLAYRCVRPQIVSYSMDSCSRQNCQAFGIV